MLSSRSNTPPPPAVVCHNVCVGYDGENVIRNVSFTVERGMFLPFIGPNGAGKTTLLRAILGLLPVRTGRIDTEFGPHPAGYVPQQQTIDPLLPISAAQLVTMGLFAELGYWRRPTADHRDRVKRVLDRLGLLSHREKTFAELSGGMKQKVLLARAMVSDAEVFVMDEPTCELDAHSEADVLSCLHDMSQFQGKTVLLAHHGLDTIASIAPTACLIEHGHARVVPMSECRLSPSLPPHNRGDSRC